LKQAKRRAGPGGGTRQLHQKHILEEQVGYKLKDVFLMGLN